MMSTLKSCKNNRVYAGQYLVLFSLFALLFGYAAGISTYGADNDVLVTVNGDSITINDLKNSIVRKHQALSDKDKESFDYEKLLNKLVNDKLIQQEAISMGIGEEPLLLEKLNDMMKDNARRAYIRQAFHPDLTVTPEEINTFFNDYYFRMKLRTISVSTKEEGEKVKQEILNGVPMDSLAQAISLDTKKFKGGEHNFLHYADIENELRIPAKKLKIGELSDPVPYRNAFVVIKLEDYHDPDTLELPLMSIRIEKILTNQKRRDAWDAFLDSLADQSPITLNQPVIDKVKADGKNIFTEEYLNYSDTPAMSIDDSQVITEGELRTEISHQAMNAGDLPVDTIFNIGLNKMKMQLVLDYTTEKNGYLDSSNVINAYNHSFDSSLVELYLQEAVVNEIRFNSDEFKAYYDEHPDEFREKPDLQLAHLILSTEDSAKFIEDRLQGGANFEFIVKQVDPENKSESTPNQWQSLMSYPEDVQEDLATLPIGGISQPYPIQQGWIIFYLKNKKLGRLKSLEEVDMQIRKLMFQKKFNALLDETLKLLKDNSDIKYYTDRIDSFFN